MPATNLNNVALGKYFNVPLSFKPGNASCAA